MCYATTGRLSNVIQFCTYVPTVTYIYELRNGARLCLKICLISSQLLQHFVKLHFHSLTMILFQLNHYNAMQFRQAIMVWFLGYGNSEDERIKAKQLS